MGDEVMVFLSLRLLKGAVSSRSCSFVPWRDVGGLLVLKACSVAQHVQITGQKLTGGCKAQLLRGAVKQRQRWEQEWGPGIL